jgi:hypothetical protein
MSSPITSVGISLGWKCSSASYGVDHGYRKRKADGYKTCPFDMMLNNYEGLVQCINDDFLYFCDTNYLELKKMGDDTVWKGETFIYNNKYKFIFNHESPGHANLYKTEQWTEGINHFISDNYKNFITRYSARINNFRNYISDAIKSGNKIIFILDRFKPSVANTIALHTVLHDKYPTLNFEIKFIDNTTKYLYLHLTTLMGCDENSEEVKRCDASCKL